MFAGSILDLEPGTAYEARFTLSDPDGFEHEHYTDGDLFTADHETEYSPLEFGGIWAWGPDAPNSMKPGKSLSTLLKVLRLLHRKAITPQRLKLLGAALDAPARPWH